MELSSINEKRKIVAVKPRKKFLQVSGCGVHPEKLQRRREGRKRNLLRMHATCNSKAKRGPYRKQ